MINKRDIKLTLDYIDVIKKEYNDINTVGSFNIVYDYLKSNIKDYDDEINEFELSLHNAIKSVNKVLRYLKNNIRKNKVLIESVNSIIDILERD